MGQSATVPPMTKAERPAEQEYHVSTPAERTDRRVQLGTLSYMIAGARLHFVILEPGTEDYRNTAAAVRSLWDIPLSAIYAQFAAAAGTDVPELLTNPALRGHIDALIEQVVLYALVSAAPQIKHANCE